MSTTSYPEYISLPSLTDRFTSDELAQLVVSYQAGEMSAVLAREGGITKSTFLRLLAEHGVRTGSRKLTSLQDREILQLRQPRMIIRGTAKKVGCSYDSIRVFLQRRSLS